MRTPETDSGQARALAFLQKHNYQIITKNFRTKFGEIDIVALEGNVLVFVEVKCRTNTVFGLPFEAVNSAKLRQIAKAGEIYQFKNKNSPQSVRIDVISILLSPGGEALNVEVLKDVS
ncbi:YraN family protein [Candidatus Gottesmanbacteria bacterium]|nr:YraN family protein [Candidatus Gottesmanbacteria bacterium]